MSDDPLKGAFAGAVGAIAAESIPELMAGDNADALTQAQRGTYADYGRLGAGVATLLAGQDVDVGIAAANNAVDNNFLFLIPPAVAAAEVALPFVMTTAAPYVVTALTGGGIAYSAKQITSAYQAGGANGAVRAVSTDMMLMVGTVGIYRAFTAFKVGGQVIAQYGKGLYTMPTATWSNFLKNGFSVERPVGRGFEQSLVKPQGITLQLEFKEGMNARDFSRKTRALQDLAERGKLIKSDPIRDKSITREYRENILVQAEKQWGQNEPHRVEGIRRLLKKVDADHLQELQLGGIDHKSALWMLDTKVNRSFGRQIQEQLKEVKTGSKISKVVARGGDQ